MRPAAAAGAAGAAAGRAAQPVGAATRATRAALAAALAALAARAALAAALAALAAASRAAASLAALAALATVAPAQRPLLRERRPQLRAVRSAVLLLQRPGGRVHAHRHLRGGGVPRLLQLGDLGPVDPRPLPPRRHERGGRRLRVPVRP